MILRAICAAFVGMFAVGCSASASYEKDRLKTSVSLKRTADKISDQAFNAYYSLCFDLLKATEGENSVVSPVSLFPAFGMVLNGASGQTLSQAEGVFAMPLQSINELSVYFLRQIDALNEENESSVRSINSLWLEQSYGDYVKQDFVDCVAEFYMPEIFSLPFDSKAVNKMNAWTYNNTDGMIKKIVDNLSATKLAVINATFVKGEWQERSTVFKKGKFTSLNGEILEADYFNGSSLLFESENAYAIKRILKSGIYYFAIMPKNGQDFQTYYDNFNALEFSALQKGETDKLAEYEMPEFYAERELDLKTVLGKMGMTKVFSNQAELDGISEKSDLFIGTAIQKSKIEVNRYGLKAAAATYVGVKLAAMPPQEVVKLQFNRPFIYAVCMPDGLPLFVGKQITV